MSLAQPVAQHDRKFFGVFTALVSSNEDPQKLGQVKLTFPWFDGGTTESDWCRQAQLYAGNGYGAVFVPEVGDEVLVAFEHGDMRKPYVLGGLYNGKDKPAVGHSASEDVKQLRTKAGHEITLDDSSGKQVVRVKTAAGQKLELVDSGSKITLDNGKGASIVLEGPNIIIKCVGLELSASGQVAIGEGANQAVPWGTTLASLLAAHVHTSSVPGSPTSPPVPPLVPAAVLSPMVKTK